MKLIGSLTSPYVRKVRIVMAEKKLDYRFELEDVWSAETKIQQYNPLGKVPCLVMEDGGALFDSRVIVEYLDTLSPVARLIPQSGRERAAVKCWEAIADGVLDAAVGIVKERQRPDAVRNEEWIARQYGKINASLDAMNKSLGEHAHCMGINHSLADVAVGCALGYLVLRFPDLDWRAGHANLARLFDKLSTRQSFIDTAPPTPA
ncbi:glutathione S-transferase [Bordetella genomosp. 9]|uniref:Glutathione S-transferase n=1 Tax=Bordetella genomosp. 9 TaxID=1416803 RepID=A0A261R2Y9_9BORD|nr:glutathione S-transferase [Bordetella genomosp. 9]OZI19414.1 glutathione S-transferase [Bordetella genomosp. 9]